MFQKNYLSRYITVDTQAAYRGLEPQTVLMRAASGMSRTIDRRRPRKLNAAQQSEVDRHPEVKLLRRAQTRLKLFIKREYGPIVSMKGTSIYDNYQRAYHDHRNTRRRHGKVLLKEVKARYKREQPVIDIQRQLKGLPIIEEKTVGAEDYVFAERVRVIEALFTFATSSPEEECKRRAEAINALTALCSLQEGSRSCRPKRSASITKLERDEKPTTVPPPRSLSDTILIKYELFQCIFCLGCEGLPTEERLRSFYAYGDLKKHFHRKHLRHHPRDEPIDCPHPRCDVTLDNVMLLQNHAQVVHMTRT